MRSHAFAGACECSANLHANGRERVRNRAHRCDRIAIAFGARCRTDSVRRSRARVRRRLVCESPLCGPPPPSVSPLSPPRGLETAPTGPSEAPLPRWLICEMASGACTGARGPELLRRAHSTMCTEFRMQKSQCARARAPRSQPIATFSRKFAIFGETARSRARLRGHSAAGCARYRRTNAHAFALSDARKSVHRCKVPKKCRLCTFSAKKKNCYCSFHTAIAAIACQLQSF